MGLTASALWALCLREYEALKRVWKERRDAESAMIAALRADLHNTSSRQFSQTFQPADFMPGVKAGIEERIHALIEQGYTPSEAAAVATSSQSREHNLYLIDGALSEAHQQKKKGARRKAG